MEDGHTKLVPLSYISVLVQFLKLLLQAQTFPFNVGRLSHPRQMFTYFEHLLVVGHGLNYGSMPTASALEGY